MIIIACENTCRRIFDFCTGFDSVPPLGFNKNIDVVFLRSQEILPTASTCALELRIPTCHKDSSTFNEKLELALKCAQEFVCV